VHGDGDNQGNEALSDDYEEVASPTTTIEEDRLAYDEGEGSGDSVYDHVTIIKGKWDYWKCGYSGIYVWMNQQFTTRTPDTPGRTNTSYQAGQSPVGDHSTTYWHDAEVWRAK